MKRNAALRLLVLLLFLGFLGACRTTTTADSVPRNLVLEGRTLSWDAVSEARGYVVTIGTDEYEVSEPVFVLPDGLSGSGTLTVRAKFGISGYFGGESEPLAFDLVWNLPSPDHLVWEEGVLSWDAVPYASGYVVSLGGAEHAVSGTSDEIGILSAPAEAKVLAVGDGLGTIVSSPWSEELLLTVRLSSPTGLSLSGLVLSWNAVPYASGYEVTVGEDVLSAAGTSLSLGYDYAGLMTVSVRALSEEEGYLASAPAEAQIDFPVLTLSVPGNLAVSGSLLSFDAVPGAGSYAVYVDGSFYAEVAQTEWGIPNELLAAQGTYLQIRALSSVHHSSALSEALYLSSRMVATEADLRAMETDGSYILSNDIVLSQTWTPKDFSGVFDGAGFTISGISISADSPRAGFFGLLEGALVENLVLSGTLDVTFLAGEGSCAGGLAGEIRNSSVSSVRVEMDLSVVSANGLAFVGGLAGKITGSSFADCLATGSLAAENAVAGGFAGKATVSDSAQTVVRSGFEGDLVVTGGEQSVAGGFLGTFVDSFLTLSESFARGTVQGTSYVGGFVGYLGTGHAVNCYFAGEVSGTGAQLLFLGGFVGRAEGYNATLVSCLAQAILTPYAENPSINVGGFAGHTPGGTYGTIYQNCAYDNTLAPFDRIGNPSDGRGDGITARGSSPWGSLSGIDPEIWDFGGAEIRLAWETAA